MSTSAAASSEADHPRMTQHAAEQAIALLGTLREQSAQDPADTTLRRLEATLRSSETLVQLALDIGGMGVWEADLRSGGPMRWNGMHEVHNLPPGTTAPSLEEYPQLVHPQDRDAVTQTLRGLRDRPEGHQIEYRIMWPDGTLHWLENRCRLLRDDQGQPRTAIGACLDITRRKSEEHGLQFLAEASAEIAALTDYQGTLDRIARLAVPRFADWCCVDLLDEDGTIRRVAAAHVDPEKEALAHEVHRRYPPDSDAAAGPWFVLRTGRSELMPQITAEMIDANIRNPGERAMVKALGLRSYLGVPLTVRDQSLGVMSFAIAQADRRYGAEDLVLAEDLAGHAAVAIDNARLVLALKESDRTKDVFLATLAHELRNPLAPIWNGLSLMKRVAGDPARVEQVTELIERQVRQLTRLVDDLLDVSRISTGKIELKKEPTLLQDILHSAIETSRPHIEARQHTLAVSIPEQPAELEADAVRLAQVFSNLLNNAAKYTRPGGRIQLTARTDSDHVVVRVSDNGSGIAPDMLGKVFDLFAQADNASERSQGGLGIGLSLVQGLVRLHGGSVQVQSGGLEQGSEFTVTLPRGARAAAR